MTGTLSENRSREQETNLASPRISNTGASSSQNPTTPNLEAEFWDDIPLSPEDAEILKKSRFTTAAIDNLDGTVFGSWPEPENAQNPHLATRHPLPHIFERLEALKEKAQDKGSPAALDLASVSEPVGVLPNGRGGGIPVQVVVSFLGCSIGIVTTGRSDGVAARYWIPGSSCLRFGAEYCYRLVLDVLAELGLEYVYDVCSRVDICADIKGLSVADFETRWDDGAVICRSQKLSRHEDKGETQTLSIGNRSNGGVYLRIYNKIAEIEAKHTNEADAYLELMAEHRWGGELPEQAVRVEFQLGRETLARISDRWGVKFRSGADVIRMVSALAHYCVGSVNESVGGGWVRFTEDRVDRENKHQSRAKICKEWRLVQQTFAACFAAVDLKPGSVKPLKTPDCRRLKKQALGLISSILTLKRVSPNADILSEIVSLVGCDLAKLRSDIQKKQFAYSLTAFGHS